LAPWQTASTSINLNSGSSPTRFDLHSFLSLFLPLLREKTTQTTRNKQTKNKQQYEGYRSMYEKSSTGIIQKVIKKVDSLDSPLRLFVGTGGQKQMEHLVSFPHSRIQSTINPQHLDENHSMLFHPLLFVNRLIKTLTHKHQKHQQQ